MRTRWTCRCCQRTATVLANLGRRLTSQALARREAERRYPILLALLAESAADVLDEVVSLFDQAISGRTAARDAP